MPQFEGLTTFELSRRVQRREFLVRNWVSGDYRDVLVWNRLLLANRCRDTKSVKVEREYLEGLSYRGLGRTVGTRAHDRQYMPVPSRVISNFYY